jgi:hypothetical protein
MPGSVEGLRAYLIVDNCFLVMLTDCFCNRFAARCNQSRLATEAEQWIDQILEILQRFALDGNMHCPIGVANEFIPHTGQMANLRGIQRNDLNHVQAHVRANLHQVPVDLPGAQSLRTLPTAPRQLVGSGGLSDNDLSLVKLALDMTTTGLPVFVLSNDQSLLDFITWIRIQKQHFQAPITPNLIQGWRCLTYLELVHRSCNITSDLMKELIEFALVDHYNRKEIAGSQKGNVIFQQLMQVYGNFNQSVVKKQQGKAEAA